MYKSVKDLNTIKFPVYPLRSQDWRVQDKVLFLEDLVLDDRNMPGKTLGIRRLQCGRKDLYKLKKSFNDLPSLIRSKKNTFIDSAGIPFVYVKTIKAHLKYHKVLKLVYKETFTVAYIEDVPFVVKLKRPPYGDARWARFLYYKNAPWLLYDFQLEKGKNSFRRV